jgi:hypothetical protein
MGVLHLRLPLTEQNIADLDDIVLEAKDKKFTENPARWLHHYVLIPALSPIDPSTGKPGSAPRLLHTQGHIDFPEGKKLTLADLKPVPLESYDEGTLTLNIGDGTKREIESVYAYLEAQARIRGWPTPPFKSPREWVLTTCQGGIASELDRLAKLDLDAEEREGYDIPPEKPKDAPKP